MAELSELKNIGKNTESLLIKAGIDEPEKLVNLGSKQDFLLMKEYDNGLCINMLYALQSTIDTVKDYELSESTKNKLKEFYNSIK
ncbi:MAG: TfoX/Sxy family protein [Clostridia bacterium]|nr:TfoX/Sxy family protein [Clostridia bacterium]